jgi:radical SAM protein with 4Fe4S-binding SPASM domain
MMDLCRNKSVETLSLYKIIPFGEIIRNKNMLISENEFLKLLPKWMNNFVENEPKWIVETEPPYTKAFGILKKYEDKVEIHYSGCKAGITLLSVMPNGKITPCHAADTKEFYCGSILEDDLKEIWENHPVLDYFNGKRKPEECDPCEYWKSCLGGCRIASLGIYNSLESKDPFCCDWFGE